MTATPNPAAPTTPLATPIDYVVGMMGRTQKGTVLYDGNGRVVLTDEDGSVVFDKQLDGIGKVRRAEWAIYLKVDGKTITLMFGNYKKYALTNAVLGAPVGSDLGQIAGTLAGFKLSTEWNREAGQDDWWNLLTAHNSKGINATPVNQVKYALIITGVIIAGLAISYIVAGA